MIPLLNFVKKSYFFESFVIELVAMYQQKVVNWVLLMQILLRLYFLQILDFLVTDLEGGLSPER